MNYETDNQQLINHIQDVYGTKQSIPLHAPQFNGNELDYVTETIKSSFVSSVGKFVDEFEAKVKQFTQAGGAVATVNGTSALHTSLYLAGVGAGDLVLTQALTFVATCNVIHHMGAQPVFIDVSPISLSLCPQAMDAWLQQHAYIDADNVCRHKTSQRIIKAALPMHTFGHPALLDELNKVCQQWQLLLIEDAAESLGSFYKGKHTGTLGAYAALSFNGNKIITSGGGGMVLCHSEAEAKRAKHLTTTAKQAHPYEFYHDQPGFNYRMPNLNAALGCAQFEQLETYLERKRSLAAQYYEFFKNGPYLFVVEPDYARSNYWLNSVICPNKEAREQLLVQTNQAQIGTRPVWQLMHQLPMYQDQLRGELTNSEWLASRLVNLPSSVVGAGV